jgi:small subunit ribosomal protein S20
MPNKAHARKSLRQTITRTARNSAIKTAYRKAVKEVGKALTEGEKEINEKLRLMQKKLDKAAKTGVIKKNTAGRKLSRMMKKVHAAAKAK